MRERAGFWDLCNFSLVHGQQKSFLKGYCGCILLQAGMTWYTQVLLALENKIQGNMLKHTLVKHLPPPPLAWERMRHIGTSPWVQGGHFCWTVAGSEPGLAVCLPAAATGRSNLSTLHLSALWSGDLIGFDRPWIPFQLGQTLHFKLKT